MDVNINMPATSIIIAWLQHLFVGNGSQGPLGCVTTLMRFTVHISH